MKGTAGRGAFITLEGVEGVGKSTNLTLIGQRLESLGRKIILTREPGGVPLAERIRGLLLQDGDDAVPPMAELLLMFAARAAHLEELIWPAMSAGTWVVSDRFTDASYAYQGGGRGLPTAVIRALEQIVQPRFQPDLTLLLDADWESTRTRRSLRGTTDRFEKEGRAFFERTRTAYLEQAARHPERIRIIDAARPLAEVQAQIISVLTEFNNEYA